MNDCCEATPKQDVLHCPQCDQKGKRVSINTVKSLLKPRSLRNIADESYFFCKTPDCETVYFSSSSQFSTPDVREKVFQKDPSSDCFVCYCFGFTREDILKDAVTGEPGIAQQISAWTKTKKCACELRNPQGSCCLGNVKQVEKEGLSLAE